RRGSRPVVTQFRGPAPGQDRAGGVPLGLELLARLRVGLRPPVQPFAVGAAEEVVLVGDVTVERDGHVEYGLGHLTSWCGERGWRQASGPPRRRSCTAATGPPAGTGRADPGPTGRGTGSASGRDAVGRSSRAGARRRDRTGPR